MEEERGRRRAQYVPIDSYIAFRKTGSALEGRWGMEGLCAWVLFLAACKRGLPQGQMMYAGESDGWGQLGATATLFTLEEFFKVTGRMKQTRITSSGRLKTAVCTHWGEWNDDYNTQLAREQKARKRGESTPDIPRTGSGQAPDTSRTVTELELKNLKALRNNRREDPALREMP